MKKVIFAVSIIMLYFIACNKKSSSENLDIHASNLRVGIYTYDYPFLYSSNNNLVGFDYDIINEIAKVKNFKLEFVPVQFEELIPSLLSKQVDIVIAGMSITEARKKLMNFSSKYYSSGQSAIINNKDYENIKTIDDLMGKSVGVIKGTISDTIVSEIKGLNVERFNIGGSAILSLKVGRIDAVVFDRVTCDNYVKYDKDIKIAEGIEFPEDDYGIAVRKEDTILLNEINQGLYTITTNGFYDKLLEKYFK